MIDCTFVTYAGLPNLDPDDKLALDEVEARGLSVGYAVWDAEGVDWANAGTVILRSTWDYHVKFDKFMAWVDRVSSVTRIFNEPAYIHWSAHKSYLNDLRDAGIAIVPTQWILKSAHGGNCNLDSGLEKPDCSEALRKIVAEQPSGKVVVKPAIGLATSGVMIVSMENLEIAINHTKELLKTNDVMVQPYMASVKEHGERALIFIEGQYCHSIRKTAFQALMPAGEAGETSIQAEPDEIALARKAVSMLPHLVAKQAVSRAVRGADTVEKLPNTALPPQPVAPLFARVDVVRDGNNNPVIMELELVEPNLFFSFCDDTTHKFADAVANRIRSDRC